MPVPRILTRITNHKNPRYQFYQPGFNDSNSCWLEGSWVDVTKEEFDKNGEAHQVMYADVRDLQRNNNHRDPATTIDKLDARQKKAWLHRSGNGMFEAQKPDGFKTRIGLELAGGEITEASKRWLKRNDWILIPEGTIMAEINANAERARAKQAVQSES